MDNEQDILKVLRTLSKVGASNVSDILYGFQKSPISGSPEDNYLRLLEQQLIDTGFVKVTEQDGTNNTIAGYYYFAISPNGIKWLEQFNVQSGNRPIHTLSTNAVDKTLIAKGLINRGLMGFLQHQQTGGTVALQGFRLTFPKGEDYFYTADLTKERLQDRNAVTLDQLGFVRLEPHSEFLQLYRFYSQKYQNHLFVVNPNQNVISQDYNKDETPNHPIFIRKRLATKHDLPLFFYSTSAVNYFTPLDSKPLLAPTPQPISAKSMAKELFFGEIANIILWDMSQQQGRNIYIDVKQLLIQYHISITPTEILQIINDKLRKELYIFQDQNDPFKIIITEKGKKHAEARIKPLAQKSRDFDEAMILAILNKHLKTEEFRIELSKDFVQVNVFPEGKSSDYNFLAQRVNGIYYRQNSNPKIDLFTRSDLDAVLRCFDLWAGEVKKLVNQISQEPQKAKPVTADKPGYYAAGSVWSDNDQASRFFKDNIWQNGNDNEYLDLVKGVAIDDTIILKSTFSRAGKSYLRVKGLGRVTANKSDGKSLSVEWHYKGPPIDIENLGFYRSTIQKLKSEDWDTIQNYINQDANKNDNVALQHDALSEVDLLGRDPFIQALADYIKNLSKTQGSNPYMIHLDGEWGSGKSNSLKFLNKKLTETNEWLIVEYNAWENQHMEPPWWNFMDTVYRGIRSKLGWFKWTVISIREFCWRFFWINRTNVAITATLVVLSVFAIWKGGYVVDLMKEDNQNRIGDSVDIIVGVTSLLGTAWLVFQWLKNSLVVSSSEAVLNFKRTASDPMVKIKNHFKTIVGYTSKNVAIFIDDIDRCDVSTVVKLLEGVQTLFKNSKLVYVVTGDGSWIKQCFECHYQKFAETVTKPGSSLGNLFQEKLFQMSITLPTLTPSTMDSFLRSLLTDPNTTTQKTQASDTKMAELRSEVSQTIGQKEENIQRVIDQYKETENEYLAVQVAVEEMSKKLTLIELEHRLQPYSGYLPPNARAIKRFINNYALRRQSLIIQGVSFDEVDFDKLVRWQVLVSRYPKIADLILQDPSFITTAEDAIFDNNDFTALIIGLDEKVVRLILGQ